MSVLGAQKNRLKLGAQKNRFNETVLLSTDHMFLLRNKEKVFKSHSYLSMSFVSF